MDNIYYDTFNGEKEIRTLSAYPIQYHKEDLDQQGGVTLESKFIQRGRKFWALSQATLRDYSGYTLSWPKRPVSIVDQDRVDADSLM